MKLFFLTILVLSQASVAGDKFSTYFSESKVSFELELDDFVENNSAWSDSTLTVTRGKESVDVPCSSLGEFLQKPDKSLEGHRRLFCQIAKNGNGTYDSINVGINYKWTKKTAASRRQGKYSFDFGLRVGSGANLLQRETRVIFGQELTKSFNFSQPVDSDGVAKNSKSPFKLIARLEDALMAHIGRTLYSGELEDEVQAWGYSYNFEPNAEVSIEGKFGSTGADFSLSNSRDDLQLLSDPKNLKSRLISGKALAKRVEDYLASNED